MQISGSFPLMKKPLVLFSLLISFLSSALTHFHSPITPLSPHHHTISYHTIPYYTILYYIIQYHTIPYHIIPCYNRRFFPIIYVRTGPVHYYLPQLLRTRFSRSSICYSQRNRSLCTGQTRGTLQLYPLLLWSF